MAATFWASLLLSLALFVLAAKTHGRQVRLERELRGFLQVTFGAGTNPPWVEHLWKRDRIRFWSLTGALVFLVLVAVLAPVRPPPLLDSAAPHQRLALALIGSVLWAPTLSFLTLAALSAARFHAATAATPAEPPVTQPLEWRRQAARGTAAYLLACLLLLAAVLGLAAT